MVFENAVGLSTLKMLLRKNIRQALKDYGRHTSELYVLNDVSEKFIDRLADNAAMAKENLRELLRKSPAWNEELQAVVINGTRTHDPDYKRVDDLMARIFEDWFFNTPDYQQELVRDAMKFFTVPKNSNCDVSKYVAAIKELAPKAYRANRKKSRIFKAICDALGITDETKGSKFQNLFAQFADEISSKKIDFKLFLSINPAHFITMSNPKFDKRGDMLTSCHSFNVTDYNYNNGCSGYARDDVTMIAFTVDNPDNPELLNNRKTTRQLFMYKVGNGLLLQNRMYNSNGGVYGTSELTPLYRDLIQRELSELEGVPNLWKTYTYCKDKPKNLNIETHYGYGGYVDWVHEEFDAKISIRLDHIDDYKEFEVGEYGLCIRCGAKTSVGLYCHNCNKNAKCECCGEYCAEDDLYTVRDSEGEEIRVCENCRDDEYTYCAHCEEYHPNGEMVRTHSGEYICQDCFDEHYDTCNDCGEYYHVEEMNWVYDESGFEVRVCDSCHEDNYENCAECGNDVASNSVVCAHDRNGDEIYVCGSCRENYYQACENCGEYYHEDDIVNGLCPNCRGEEDAE